MTTHDQSDTQNNHVESFDDMHETEINFKNTIKPETLKDLQASGLEPKDMLVRNLSASECSSLSLPFGTEGYIIPYYDIEGTSQPFYRAKILKTVTGEKPLVKYIQPKNSVNHIYFPKGFLELVKKNKYIILTEGEKKASCAVKMGIPACAVSGIDSWRNRTIILPKDTQLFTEDTNRRTATIAGKLPGGTEDLSWTETVAMGVNDLIYWVKYHSKTLFLAFDWDITTDSFGNKKQFQKIEVERALASLGIYLKSKDIPSQQIRTLKFGFNDKNTFKQYHNSKLGLDDFLTFGDTTERLHDLNQNLKDNMKQPIAFPNYPNPKDYIARKLGGRLKRSELQNVIFTILVDLDYKGKRLKAPEEQMLYYFDKETKELMKVAFSDKAFSESKFAIMCYRRYGISKADTRIWEWLETLYNSEEPVETVTPQKLIHVDKNNIYYQINDGQYVSINVNKIEVFDNGENGILFELGHTLPISAKDLHDELDKQRRGERIEGNWWYTVLRSARLKESPGDKVRRMLSLLNYISPWFYKWRQTQLPIEMAFGEAGSGKSSLYIHRLNILTGKPLLRNSPDNLKDWTTSVASSGGLHVIDNVHMLDKNLKQRLSDEMCRLVTETNPSFESRKLFTDNTQVRMPVKSVFAVTAVTMPFTNIDIVQRSIIMEFDKGTDPSLTYDSNWNAHQLEKFGGRIAWIAHHLLIIQKIMQLVNEQWNPNYSAKFRLINVEQLLIICDKVFGSKEHNWISETLASVRDERVASADWALEGLTVWADYQRTQGLHITNTWTTSDICDWCSSQEAFAKNNIFENPRALSRYIQMNKHSVATLAGITAAGTRNNKMYYKVVEFSTK